MEEYIRVVNENGITKVYYKPENHTEEVLFYELKMMCDESVRICTVNGKLVSQKL